MGAEGADHRRKPRRFDRSDDAAVERRHGRPRRFYFAGHGKGSDEGTTTAASTEAASAAAPGPSSRPVAAAADPSSAGPPSAGGNGPAARTRPRPRADPGRASTSYSLFSSNPNRFAKRQIYGATHFLTDRIEGRAWLDADGDGKRDDADRRLGVGGVKARLVDCATDRPVAGADDSVAGPVRALENPVASLPTGPRGGNAVANRSEDPSAGLYSFPIARVPPGRYYLVYTAPRDYRISGNVLPLDRDGPSFDCVPAGGEGGIYLNEARRYGDFDLSGYCARSIGCFEVGQKKSVHEKSNFDDYDDLDVLDGNQELKDRLTGGYETYVGSLAAVPFAEYFDVGLAREEWELPTYQYADLEVSFAFPPSVDPRSVVPKDFERSPVRAGLEEGLARFLGGAVGGGGSGFEIGGVDVHAGEVRRSGDVRGRAPSRSRRSMLRGARSVRSTVNLERKAQGGLTRVTYTLTARGHYRPPPYQQLGSVVEDSINRDPQKLAQSLVDREVLPDVVAQDVEATWLTMKEEPEATVKLGPKIIDAGGFVFMGSWAFILAISLAVFLAFLSLGACLCLCWRARTIRSASSHPPRVEERKEARKEVKLVESMNKDDILQELKSLGIAAPNAMSRKKLEDELIEARFHTSYLSRKKEVTFTPPTTPDEGGDSPAEVKLPEEPKRGKPRGFFRFLRRVSSIDEDEESRRREVRLVESMSVREIRDELESYGLSRPGVLTGREKLEEELIQARFDNTYSRNGPEKRKKVTFSFTTVFSSAASSNSRDTIQTNPTTKPWATARAAQPDFEEHEKTEEERRQQLDEAMQDCASLKGWELRRMLKSMGASSAVFAKKKELVRAVAEARVNGTKAGTTEKDAEAQRHSPSPGRGRIHTGGARSGRRGGDKTPGPKKAQTGVYDRRRRSSPGPAPILRTPSGAAGAIAHSPPRPKEIHSREPMQSHSRFAYQPFHPEQIHCASARRQAWPRSDERRSTPEKSSRHQGARKRDPDQSARRRRRHEERNDRAQAQVRTRARTRSAELRRDGSGRPRPEEPRASRSCPTSAYQGGWDEAAYYSRFLRPGGQGNDNETHRSRSAPKPRSEERKARTEACPKARRWSEERPPARKRSGERRGKRRPGGDPRGKGSRRDRSGRRARRPSCEIDSLFGDEYSFQMV